MNDRFATGAVQLAGIAARMLGWRPAEFWAATPAELAAAIAPPGPAPSAMLDRGQLTRMMEHEHGNCGK